MNSKKSYWTNTGGTGGFLWCRMRDIPIKELEVFNSSNFINDRFELLDL